MNICVDCPASFTTFPVDFQPISDDFEEVELAFALEELVHGQVFNPTDPLTDAQAEACPQREHWAAARQDELSSHVLHKTYGDPIVLPPGQMFTNTGFIDRSIERRLMRLEQWSGSKQGWSSKITNSQGQGKHGIRYSLLSWIKQLYAYF